jgi:competence protein ComGB
MDLFQKRLMHVTLFRKPLTKREQGLFLKRLGMLLKEGFSLKEALGFQLAITQDEKKDWLYFLQDGLETGAPLHEELLKVGFPKRTCTQLYLALVHGKYAETVERCGRQLLSQVEKKKKFMQIIHYPVMLVLFMIAMLFAMRYILLPHIHQLIGPNATMTWSTRLILSIVYTSPYWIVGSVILFLGLFIGMHHWMKKKTAIQRLSNYCKLPFFSVFLRLYWTHFFVYEWGQLLDNGCSMKEIVAIMQAKEAPLLLQEVSQWIQLEMEKGRSLKEALSPFYFLKKEIAEIISHGEASGNLGVEFILFAQECEEELTHLVEQWMERIQPIIFIFVACMIIAIYAALLLPTFSLLEGL